MCPVEGSPSEESPVFTRTQDGWRFYVRLTPGARRTALDGTYTRADGVVMIRAFVTAAPENGKANEALIVLLSKNWKVPKSSLRLVSGFTDRVKGLVLDAYAPPAFP